MHAQAELDLLVHREGKLHGFEFKYASAPRLTASMRRAMSTLELESMTVVSPIEGSYPLGEGVMVREMGECVLG